MTKTKAENNTYLFTFHRLGNQVKVTAIDEKSGAEVSVIAPFMLSKNEMQTLALNKLQAVLKKQHDKNS